MSRLSEKKKTKMDTTEGSMTSYWIKFFKSAGVPVSDAANYALAFSDNRIQREMLMDLTKEYLNDMGITRLGDVIAILKHAKSVHGEDAREKILQSETRGQSVLTTSSVRAAARASPTGSPVLGRKPRSTPASRLVDHYTGNDPQAMPLNQPSPPASSRVALTPSPSAGVIRLNTSRQKEVVPVPKKRRVFPEHEGKYKIFMPSGTTDKTKKILEQKRLSITEKRMGTKSSVFERLGRDSPTEESSTSVVTVTGLDKVVMRGTDDSSVFGRLGSKTAVKRAATSTSDDLLDDEEGTLADAPLQYEGVLKNTAKKAKPSRPSNTTRFNITIKSEPFKKKLGTHPVKVEKEEGSLASDQVAARNLSVKNRLGGVVSAPASSTTSGVTKPAVKHTTIKLTKASVAKPKQLPSKNKLASLNKPVGVRKRLGATGEVSSSIQEEVSSTAGNRTKSMAAVKSKGVFGRLGQQV